MDTLFPFGLPGPTQFYLTLYCVTLIIHVVFMNYVLAGTAYMATTTVLGGDQARDNPIIALLRDWMPFMLSAAITAGVAPLLFLQILYQYRFYVANLLLFSRWMAILPVLIVGFYLLYLLKSKLVMQWALWGRLLVGVGALFCFGFVGWSWTENHLLSISEGAWIEHQQSGAFLFRTPELPARLATWFVGAFPTMAAFVGWQLWYLDRYNRRHAPQPNKEIGRSTDADQTGELAVPDAATILAQAADGSNDFRRIAGTRRISMLAIGAIILSGFCGVGYIAALRRTNPEAGDLILGSFALPYLIAALVGLALQSAAWVMQYRLKRLTTGLMSVISGGLLLSLTGTTVVREAIRVSAIDLPSLYAGHADSAQVDGFWAFAIFFLVNGGLIAWCFHLVRRGLRKANAAS